MDDSFIVKQFYIPIFFAFLISATHSSEVQAQMWYPESRDYPEAKQEFVLSWCKSKNWLEKWWCDCCSDEDIEEVKKIQKEEIAKWEKENKKSQELLKKLSRSSSISKTSRFDEDIEERLEVLEQKVRELESR